MGRLDSSQSENRTSCHITSVHPALDPRIFFKHCVSLVEAGYSVTLICQADSDHTVQGVKIVHLNRANNRFKRMFLLPLWIIVKAMRQRASIYHIHDPELLPAALFLKIVGRKRVVYDVHEDIAQALLDREWIPRWQRRSLSKLVGYLERRIAMRLDCIITATPHIKENFTSCRHVVDVMNYPRFATAEENVQEVDPRDVGTLAYVGGLEEVRGIREMIQALGFLSAEVKVRLRLAGPFSEQAFQTECEELPEWDRVEYIGVIPHESVHPFLENAQIGLVCLHPLSRFLVSYPLKLFEYMDAGIPIVASDFPLWRDIIEKAGCGILVNPLDPRHIAEAVDILLSDPSKAEAMGASGKEYVRSNFNWKTEEEKLLAAYDKILG